MSGYVAYYVESNVVCFIIFAIMLAHDLLNVDRQERQIKYDHALIAFMLYFVSDSFWAAVESDVIPKTEFSVVAVHFSNYLLMAAITYMWLRFVMAVEQAPHRERPLNKFAVLFPFIVSTIALIVTFLVAPQVLINDALETQPAFSVFFLAVPYIYIAAVIVYTSKRAKDEENPAEKRKHLYVGLFPLIVIVGGLAEMLTMSSLPIFCYSCTILMLIFYIHSMETQISIDPLTNLNNRGQLLRYVTSGAMASHAGKSTFVIMIDVNDFKLINDTYGHAEGDRALIIIAESLRQVVNNHNMSIFLGRYGGDEFILIVHPESESDIDQLIAEMRSQIERTCASAETPYTLSVGAGYDELIDEQDTFQKCMQRADHKLYMDKKRCKSQGQTTICR